MSKGKEYEVIRTFGYGSVSGEAGDVITLDADTAEAVAEFVKPFTKKKKDDSKGGDTDE